MGFQSSWGVQSLSSRNYFDLFLAGTGLVDIIVAKPPIGGKIKTTFRSWGDHQTRQLDVTSGIKIELTCLNHFFKATYGNLILRNDELPVCFPGFVEFEDCDFPNSWDGGSKQGMFLYVFV